MTTINDALRSVSTIFLDTAPVIYFVEQNQTYFARAKLFFDRLDASQLTAVTSPITLAECLFYPYKQANTSLVQAFTQRLVTGINIQFVAATASIADQSAQLRAHYNLGFPDAFQIATAIHTGCDAFLTNDHQLKRITELKIIVLDETEP